MNSLIKKFIVSKDSTIYNAIKLINKNTLKTLLVVEKNYSFIGTITDGDIRRALLKGVNIKSKLNNIYNKKSKYFFKNKIYKSEVKNLFTRNNYNLIPVLNKKREIVDIISNNKISTNKKNIKKKLTNCIVVITAGGKGTRLSPFTKILPKPLVPINGKPILEIIIEKFKQFKINKFFLTTHFKSRILEAYLQETYLAPFVKILYEKKPLGTIGSLSNLKRVKAKNIIITTCDTLINIDYKKFLDFHLKNKNAITIAAAKYDYSIPYGVCKIDKYGQLIDLLEKPKYSYLMNSGMYIFDKKLLNLMQENRYIDFDKFLKKLQIKNYKIGVFKINSNNVQDFGKWNDFEIREKQ
jgi:choline kinase/predicted transcriptional regulator